MSSRTVNLQSRFLVYKEVLPPCSLEAKWNELRLIFNHFEQPNFSAQNAIYEIKYYGERTKERWISEYRQQRKLSGILRGKKYKPSSNIG